MMLFRLGMIDVYVKNVDSITLLVSVRYSHRPSLK